MILNMYQVFSIKFIWKNFYSILKRKEKYKKKILSEYSVD